MNRVPSRFSGSLEQLQSCVGLTGAVGKWEPMPAGFWRFRCRDGAILNWWQSTGTFNFQGPPDAASRLKQALVAAVSDMAPNRPLAPPVPSFLAKRLVPTTLALCDHPTSKSRP